jgi:hypothetical protein
VEGLGRGDDCLSVVRLSALLAAAIDCRRHVVIRLTGLDRIIREGRTGQR